MDVNIPHQQLQGITVPSRAYSKPHPPPPTHTPWDVMPSSSQDLQQSQLGRTDMPQAPCLAAPQRQACDGHCLALQPLPEP